VECLRKFELFSINFRENRKWECLDDIRNNKNCLQTNFHICAKTEKDFSVSFLFKASFTILTVEAFLYMVNPETELQELPLANSTTEVISLLTEAVETERCRIVKRQFYEIFLHVK
jgi:hypothetical protein